MSGPISCAFPTDYPSDTSFTLQVSNATSSIYSDLFVSVPAVATATAQLTDSPSTLFLAASLSQGCNRQSPLCAIVDDNEYCAQINPNSAGRAAVTTIENTDYSGSYWESLTSAFYVDAHLDPFSVYIPHAGSYYACTSGLGDVDLYFRLNTTTAPRGCEDVILKVQIN